MDADPPTRTRPPPTKHTVANALVVAGLAITAVMLVVPFARNDAGCLDHCADDGAYFFAHPLHNVGAPLSAVGIVACVALWRSIRWRRRAITWLASSCGWIGLVLLYDYAPAVISELYLYGGPQVETSDTAGLIAVGWLLLWVGAILAAPTPGPGANPTPRQAG